MQSSIPNRSKKSVLAFAASALILGVVITGCTSSVTSTTSTSNLIPNVNTSTTPVRITDAASDQVIAVSLTLNSIVLTDTAEKVTTNLLVTAGFPNGIPFEAIHLDAVQEPLFSPGIPPDTYYKVTLTYSNVQVWVTDSTGQVHLATVTLTKSSSTYTFSPSINISNTTPYSFLVDFLVANSVSNLACTVSGCTVTVTPDFVVKAVPISSTLLMTTHKGKVWTISTNSFTLIDPAGTTQTIYVNSATVYQGISGFSALASGDLVEVDTTITPPGSTLPAGSLVASRVEVDDTVTGQKKLLLGLVTSRTPTATGTAATSFSMLVRQLVGNSSATATAVDTVDVTVGSAIFVLPPRYAPFATALPPFTPSFNASTIFAGQHVAVVTDAGGVSIGRANAATILLQPQTINGTIAHISPGTTYTVYTVTLPPESLLAKLTGQSTVLVYTNSMVVPLVAAPTATSNTTFYRFNGYLFNDGGTLKMLAIVQAGPPGFPLI